MTGRARVGTSGWSYREWVGPFYPPGISAAGMLGHYAAHFDAVEAHGTFRRQIATTTLSTWAGRVPDGFHFAPKAHLGIANRNEHDGVTAMVTDFVIGLSALGDRLGPIYLQLPQHLHRDLDRLDATLAGLPCGQRLAFDPQHESWHDDEVFTRLAEHGATLVLHEDDERAPAVVDVGRFAYARLRKSSYADAELAAWADRIAGATAAGRDVYAFVKHDAAGAAPGIADRLLDLIGAAS